MSNVFEKNKTSYTVHVRVHISHATSFCATSFIQDLAHSYAEQRNTAETVNVFDRDRQKTEIDKMRLHFLTNDNIEL